MSLVKSYEGGRESHAHKIVQSLFEEYLSVEELFSDNIQVSVIIWLLVLILCVQLNLLWPFDFYQPN